MDDDMLTNEQPDEELARLAQETINSQVNGDDAPEMRIRCQRVIDLYAAGKVLEPRDFFHAALVLLYGEKTSHYELARTFALRSARAGEGRAWTVYAMAWDRWLLSVNRPQRYGTQIIKRNGLWTVGEVDTTVSDNERALLAVPPLYVQKQRAAQLQRQEQG